jgi:hypothetical protein
MAKIIRSKSGPIPPDPNDPAPRPLDGRKEVVVTPNPRTKAQRQANAKAKRLEAARIRELFPALNDNKSRKKTQRRRKRKQYKQAVEDGLRKGTISPEQATKLLPSRQNRAISE